MQTDPKRRTILTFAEAEDMHAKLAEGAAHTAKWLAARTNDDPMSLLRAMRFDMVGHDPLTGEPLNVVEQLNQTFRNLALDGAFLGCRSTLTRDERATALMRAGAVIQILLFPLRHKLKRDQ
jgi:hypothetical protein